MHGYYSISRDTIARFRMGMHELHGTCPWSGIWWLGSRAMGYSLSAEELHAQQSEDHNEEEEQEEQTDDGLHGAEQRHYQVTQRRPVPESTASTSAISSLAVAPTQNTLCHTCIQRHYPYISKHSILILATRKTEENSFYPQQVINKWSEGYIAALQCMAVCIISTASKTATCLVWHIFKYKICRFACAVRDAGFKQLQYLWVFISSTVEYTLTLLDCIVLYIRNHLDYKPVIVK